MSVELHLIIHGRPLTFRAGIYDSKGIDRHLGASFDISIKSGRALYLEVKYIEDYDTYLAVRDLLRDACANAFGRTPVIYPITASKVLMGYLDGVDNANDVDEFHLSLMRLYEENREKLAEPIPNPRPVGSQVSPGGEPRNYHGRRRDRGKHRIGRREILVIIAVVVLFILVSIVIMSSNSSTSASIPTPPALTTVNRTWVSDFIAIVNQYRANESAPPLTYSSYLASFSEIRFHTMTAGDNYEISHYGFDQDFNSYFSGQSIAVGEVVFYPEGETPSQFVTTLIDSAHLYWKLLMDPEFTQYGYFVGRGDAVIAEGVGAGSPPSTIEIPGPNINITQFIANEGYTPVVQNSTWLVIDLAS